MDRYYDKVLKVEVFAPGPNVAILPPENAFWATLPKTDRLTYDGQQLPNGTEPKPPVVHALGSFQAIRDELIAADVGPGHLSVAMYLDSKGDNSLLLIVDAAVAAIAASQSVTTVEVLEVMQV